MIIFIIGLVIGAALGMFTMALLVMSDKPTPKP